MTQELIKDFGFKPDPYGKSNKLAILLHAYTSSGAKLHQYMGTIVREKIGHVDLLVPELPASVFSLADPIKLVAELLNRIDALWDERCRKHGGGYDGIVLVGHSLGAILARKLYVCACGENPETPFDQKLKDYLEQLKGKSLDTPRDWANSVDRIVLLAGTNRGWSISHHMSLFRAILWSVGAAIGKLIMLIMLMSGKPRTPLIFAFRRGAPFLTQLRLQWLKMLDNYSQKLVGQAPTIQLLGSIDDLVSPEDNIDLISGRNFIYLDVPGTGHEDIIHMDNSDAGEIRRECFIKTLTCPPQDLEKLGVQPDDRLLPKPDPHVKNVIFVIHGIRDLGYWTHKIARRV